MKAFFFRRVLRTFKKNLSISLINILGLTIGITSVLSIIIYSKYEYSYDKFHGNSKNIYRVAFRSTYKGRMSTETTINPGGLVKGLKQEFPEVLEATRIYIENNKMFQYKNKIFYEDKVFWVDSTFLTIFSFPLIENKEIKSLLTQPNTLLISESAKIKYFGDENPIGKIITVDGSAFKVEGVFKNVPDNSHLKFNLLLSYKTLSVRRNFWADQDWNMNSFLVYVGLLPNTDIKQFESKLPAMWNKYYGESMKRDQIYCESFLQPLEDIHLNSHLFREADENGYKGNVVFLIMIGFFVIIISWLNYTIISTSMSLERAKEIGIEKVNGALRMDMIKNSMLETSCYCGIATLISIILIIVIQPLLNQFSGLTDSYSFLGELWFWLVLAGIFVLSSLFAGFYAALILSSYNPIVVLKGKLSHSKKGIILRKTLLVLQFSISIALTIATFVVYKQLQFMREKEIGMNIKNKLIIKSPKKVDRDSYVSSYRSFKNEIMRNNNLVSCACSVDIPGADAYQGLNFARLGANVGEVVQAKQNSVDFDFIPTYKIKMLSGRNFDPNISTNNVMIISRIFSEKLGFKHPQDAINMQVFRPSAPEVVNRIIGVFKEYNQVSPKIKIDPMYFVFSENRPRFFTVQFKGSMNAETISFIESKWKQIFPGNAFDYFILEDFYNKQFKKDQNFGKIFVIFTCLAIFITCLGLYGFSSYSTISKQKVIGIRKVMGANIFNIWQTFIREYFVLIGISMIISIPLIYYFMDRWLNSFADRIKLSAGIFFFPPLLVILVAIAAVSYHIVKISLINPIKSLKYE